MKPNDVIDEYYDLDIKLTVKEMKGDPQMILIEGHSKSLEFLGKLLIAHAENRESQGCGHSLSPNGPGNAYFSKESTKGLYIHNLPCEYEGKETSHL